jgi:hypothetical protein
MHTRVSPSPLIAGHLTPPPCHPVPKSIPAPIDPSTLPPPSPPPVQVATYLIASTPRRSAQQRPTDDQAARWDGDACPRRRRVRLHRPRHGSQGVHHQRHHVCRRQKGLQTLLPRHTHLGATQISPHLHNRAQTPKTPLGKEGESRSIPTRATRKLCTREEERVTRGFAGAAHGPQRLLRR